MGGSINITLRKNDGTEYRMSRWTNIMPYFITNHKMINGDEEHIKEFLKSWEEMKEDSDSGRNELPMTDVYYPYDNKLLYPDDYGLVVVDFINKKILTMQGYTRIGTQIVSIVDLTTGFSLDEERKENIKTLSDLGRTKIELRNKDKTTIDVLSYNHLLELLEEEDKKSFLCPSLIVDMSPFSIEKFEETLDGSRKMRQRVLELGFSLSQREIDGWDNWDKERLEFEGEDEDES